MEAEINKHKIKHLDNFREITEKYDHFIFDMDGVIWIENKILHECVDTIKNLILINKKVYFLTNNNRHTRRELLEKLIKIGLDELLHELNDIKSILNASYLLASYIKNYHQNIKKIYLIGTESFKKTLEEQGFEVVGAKDHSNKTLKISQAEALFEEIEAGFDACVSGFDDEINYYKLSYATQVIMQTGNLFGATRDSCYLVNNRRFPSSIGIINMLETTTDIKATIISKPDPRSLQVIMETHDIKEDEKGRIVMIGDNLDTDILFANNAGIDSVLVFTGMTNENEFYKMIKKGEIDTKQPLPDYTMRLLTY